MPFAVDTADHLLECAKIVKMRGLNLIQNQIAFVAWAYNGTNFYGVHRFCTECGSGETLVVP